MKLRALAVPLALASALLLNGVHLRAQAPAAQTEPAPEAHVPEAHAQAGHEPAEAGAHHGAEVKLFGMPLSQAGQFAVRVVNFGIFFAVLYFALKGALASAFKTRAKELAEQLDQAEQDKMEGEAQLRELEAKMAGLHEELEGILAKAGKDAEAEKQRILDAARLEAEQILLQTRSEIAFQQRLAEKELRALVAELAVEGAARRLETQVQGALAEQVLDRAIQEVGGAK